MSWHAGHEPKRRLRELGVPLSEANEWEIGRAHV